MREEIEKIAWLLAGSLVDPKITVEQATEQILTLLDKEIQKARISENQMHLDKINNFKPKPGQMTSANFGSASGAIETAGWKNGFEDRIKQLEKGE